MKLLPLCCVSLMFTSAVAFVLPCQAGKPNDKIKNRSGATTYRPHIKPTPIKSDFMSESEVSGKLKEKNPPGVITYTLEQLEPVSTPAPARKTAPLVAPDAKKSESK